MNLWLEKVLPAHLRLRTKFIILVNLLIAVFIAFGAFYTESRQRRAIISELQKRALVMARSLAEASTNPLLTYNYVAIEQNLSLVTNEKDVVYALVLDKEGNLAASSVRTDRLNQLLSGRISAEAKGAREPLLQPYVVPGINPEPAYDVVVPVFVEGSPDKWGTVRLGVSLETMNREIARTRKQIALFGIVALALGSLSSIVLARRITNPLQKLTEGVAAVGRGELGHSIEVTSQDELGDLAATFNKMTKQLTHLRELEDKVRRSEHLAALGTMAAGIAHDIRNPLTSISIFTQLMSLHYDDPTVREKFERVVPRELDRVQAVIEDMLELARSASLTLEPTSVNEVLVQALEIFEEQVGTQRIGIVKELSPNLPTILADRKRLHRCFSNLLANAIQAMPDGGRLCLTTVLEYGPLSANGDPIVNGSPSFVKVTVSDNGQGIPADQLPRIFNPFFTTKEKGIGLGMAITHRIVEDHKGAIDVASTVGQGTTFAIHLPAAPSRPWTSGESCQPEIS